MRKCRHEGGMVYWIMSPTAGGATLVNRCRGNQTCEARRAAGNLPERSFSQSKRAEDA